MSVAARNWADSCKTGSRLAKSVLMVLANAAKEKPVVGGRGAAHQCHLSQGTIAERVEYSVPSVKRAIRALNVAGLVLTRFRGDSRGYRTSSEFYLNINGEPIKAFAERCGITRLATPPKDHSDTKGWGAQGSSDTGLGITGDPASLNRELNREGTRAKRRSRSTELPGDWMLPEDERRHLRGRYEVTDPELDKLVGRFIHHYRHVASPRHRQHHDWPARFEGWCMKDLPLRQGCRGELSIDHWVIHLRGWRDLGHWHPALGAMPDHPACRAPQAAFDELGMLRAQSAA